MTKDEREKLEEVHGHVRDVAAWLDANGGARLVQDSTVKVLGIAAMLRALLSQPEEPAITYEQFTEWLSGMCPGGEKHIGDRFMRSYCIRCLYERGAPQPEEEPGPNAHAEARARCAEMIPRMDAEIAKARSLSGEAIRQEARAAALEEAAKLVDAERRDLRDLQVATRHSIVERLCALAARIRGLAEAKRGSGGR